MATEFVSGNGAPVVGVRGLSQVERVVDTFVSPTKTFTDILRNASWWLPFVLMLIGALGVTSVVNTKVGFERVAQNQIHASPKAEDALSQLDPAQREQRVRLQASIIKGTSYGFPVLLLIGFAVYLPAALGFIQLRAGGADDLPAGAGGDLVCGASLLVSSA